MDSIYTVASNCSSVTYGNIAQHIREYVRNLFPKDFFKYETISSEIAYRNIRRQLGANTRKDLAKRTKPYLIIRPVITVPDEMYLYGTPLTTNMDHVEQSLSKNALLPIIQDTSTGIGLSYKLNRDKIEFQVTVTVSTMYQQIDLYKSLANTIFWNRPFTKRFPMESMIPRGIISVFAGLQHIDINKERYASDILLDYLNTNSSYPITYKMRNGTSKDEFFMYSNQEVLLTLEDLQIDEGSRKNMADDMYNITFRVTAEFNIPGLFVLYGSEALKEKAMGKEVRVEMSVNDQLSFPLFTIENLFGDSEDYEGFRKFRTSIMEMEPDKITGNDETDLSFLLNDEIVSIIRFYCSNKMDMNTLIHLNMYKNSDQLVEGEDYSIDWYKTKLTTFKPSKDASYRMIMYINMIKVNELLVEYTDNNSTDRPNIKK